MTHAIPGPSGTLVPGGTVPSSSPGINPRWHTEAANASSLPAPWRNNQASTLSTMMPIVTIGGRTVGLSSLYGNTPENVARLAPARPRQQRAALPYWHLLQARSLPSRLAGTSRHHFLLAEESR